MTWTYIAAASNEWKYVGTISGWKYIAAAGNSYHHIGDTIYWILLGGAWGDINRKWIDNAEWIDT